MIGAAGVLREARQLPYGRVAAELLVSDEVALIGHLKPDADALGSALALGLALRRRGVSAVVSFSEPYLVPDRLLFLPGLDLLRSPGEVPVRPTTLVALDTGSVDRLGTLADRVQTAHCVVVIDHHASNGGFGSIKLIDPAAAATGELVAGLIDELRVPYDVDIATALYAAICSDTGSFRFSSVTPALHRLTARLLEAGARPEQIADEMFDNHPAGWLPMMATALARIRTEVAGQGMVLTWITRADLARFGIDAEQAESVVDVLRQARGSDVSAVCKEVGEATWSISLRSRGGTDVGALCTALGGGGHRLAAGFTAHDELEPVVARLRSAVLSGAYAGAPS